jgi:hypothetical protein
MKLRISQGQSTDTGSFGTMTLGELSWPCLELPYRNNQNGLSRILPGNYTAKLAWSEHFGRDLYHLQDANGRHAIEIHSANFAGDILLGWKSQLHGCVAPGKAIGQLDRGDGVMQNALLQSRQALEEFMAAANGEDLEIEVVVGS